jgi:IS30 family transposase
MRGKELTSRERERIEWYLKGRWSIRDIGRTLGRNHGVVSREIGRNSKPDGSYSAVYAQQACDKRRVRRGNVKRKLDRHEKLQEWVVTRLKDKRGSWAPDAIAGRLKLCPPRELCGVTISTESIYQWLYEGEGHARGYWQYLPSKQKRRRKQGTRRKHRKTSIPGRVSIHQRDEGVEGRLELGHWESDSVIYGKSGGQRLSVQTERKSRYVKIHRLPSGSSQHTLDALRETICSVPQDLVKSITFDNGSEGALHEKLNHDYNIKTFFCDPYCSYQKGSTENNNRLVRRHIPRGTNISKLTDQEIYDTEKTINNIPRKVLGYFTPKEVLLDLSPEVVH